MLVHWDADGHRCTLRVPQPCRDLHHGGRQQQPCFYEAFPAWTYDSFWTIGMETTRTMDNCLANVNLPPATELCAGLGIDNGSLYITGSTDNWPANALAGDLKVLIARVTTCKRLSIQACIQVFVGEAKTAFSRRVLKSLCSCCTRLTNRMLATTTFCHDGRWDMCV